MGTRVCYICHIEKPLDDFYSDPTKALGKAYRCKPCSREMDRLRDKSPHRIAKAKRWLKSERGKELLRQQAREDYRKNKQKYLAQSAIRRLIKKGIVKRQFCEVCGNGEGGAHHPDYSKPLDVVWLCQKHHAEEHRK